MDHPSNILNNLRSIFIREQIRHLFSDILLITRKRLFRQDSTSEFMKLSVTFEFTVEDF